MDIHSFNPYKISSKHPLYGRKANSADPDQKPNNQVSDQGLHCLLTECSIKIWGKNEKKNNAPKIGNWFVLLIRVSKSIWLEWVD